MTAEGISAMVLGKWEDLPQNMQTPEVRKYYDILAKHKAELVIKRAFDIIAAFLMLLIFAIPMAVIAVLIVLDSPGGVFYRQSRITANGQVFRIHKFRTMVANADKIGAQVTVGNDRRITKIGARLRKYRLDEMPQLFDVLSGSMSFVGTRPEVAKYVEKYTNEMMATLLLPAGITSEASIRFKSESELLDNAEDVDRVYTEEILPRKMYYNLRSLKKFTLFGELMTMIRTVLAVLGRNYKDVTEEKAKI